MEEQEFRDALLQIAYSVFILTIRQGDEINACTGSQLMQVSFEPPMVAIAVDKNSYSHKMLFKEGALFAINLLDSRQLAIANRLALPHRMRPQQMAGIRHRAGQSGAPILEEAIAYVECKVRSALDTGGDHSIFVGEVVAGGVVREAEPLTLRESGLKYR